MNSRLSRLAGSLATILLTAWIAPGGASGQCPTCGPIHEQGPVYDSESLNGGFGMGDGYDGGCYEGQACDGAATFDQRRHEPGHWARHLRTKFGDSGGNGKHCGRPAPPYPVPFATPKPTVPTYFTYPPLMPHHSLPHYRNVYSYHHTKGLGRTNVNWQPSYAGAAFKYVHHLFELPR